MRKFVIVVLLLSFVMGLACCNTQNPMQNALTVTHNTGSIKIRVYPTGEKDFVDYAITDRQAVREICDEMCALSLEKVKITEPLGTSCSIMFCNAGGVPIHSITLIAGKNVIDYDGEQLYLVQDDFDMHAYVARLVESATPCNP